jgi:hypothetical protein
MQAQAAFWFIFSKILVSFSLSVAAVKGLTM